MPKPRILLVDDEARFRANLQKMLGAQGLAVMAAGSGAEALEELALNPYDVIVLDIRMPGHTGYEVCAYAKSSEKNGKTPVLLISAFPEEKAAWRLSKADAFLAKPFETGQLIMTVDRLLKGSAV